MCGIIGAINLSLDNKDLDSIGHRGPDDRGLNNFRIGEHSVALGHTRLSIVDLSNLGHQPMISENEQFILIFNGEIYNHLELRTKLPDVEFKSSSDTETVLYYLIEYGVKGLSDFNGIFALAFVDREKDSIYLARDPFGVKPLYYSFADNSFSFSSEIRGVKNRGEVSLSNLACALRLRFTPSPFSLFTSTEKVVPGEVLHVNCHQAELRVERKFYSALSKADQLLPINRRDAVGQYARLFEEAVKRQLMSDVEVGILLSGGVDSALVAAIAQKHSSYKMKCFTIGFEGVSFGKDEIEAAKKTAEYLGLEHYVERISFEGFISTLKECIRIVEEPVATTSIIPMYYLSKLASTEVKVVLSGQGADEPLGGYRRYRGELLISKYGRRFSILNSLMPRIFKNIIDERLLKLLHEKDYLGRFLSSYEVFNEKEISELIGIEENKSLGVLKKAILRSSIKNNAETVEKMMSIDSRLNLSDDLLLYTDKITMHDALECRVPMLDIHLIDYIERLPRKLKLNLWNGKIIHRKFAKKVLPKEIVNRKKLGFESPTEYWFRSESKVVKGILLNSNSKFSQIFNLRKVNNIIEEHLSGKNRERQIFLLLSVFYWLEDLDLNDDKYEEADY